MPKLQKKEPDQPKEDDVLKRMLKTPPKPHAPKKTKPATKPKNKDTKNERDC